MTAKFLKEVNDMFDMLNVRAYTTKTARPLHVESTTQVAHLTKMKDESLTWYVVGTRCRTRPPCFDGIVQNVNAVLAIHDELVVKGSLKFLLTGRFNQDCVENLFSQIRARGGHRFNPSAKEFRFAYRILCSNFILARIPSANCAFDDDTMLSSLARMSGEARCTSSNKPQDHSCKKPRLTEPVVDVIQMADFETPTEVTNVLTYIAGYLIYKLKNSDFTCTQCLAALSISDSNVVDDGSLYLHLRAYSYTKGAFGGLTVPSPGLVATLKKVENLFGKKVNSLLTSSSLLHDLTQHVCDHVTLTTLNVCSSHTDITRSLIVTYLRCRLHYHFKFETRCLIQAKKGKRSRKAQILLHE